MLIGANFFFYYGTSIFTATGLSNSYVTSIILGGVNFGMTFFGLYVVERFGRRKSLIVGGLLDVCMFHDIRFYRPLLARPEEPDEHSQIRHCHDCLRLPVHCCICHDMGPHRLGCGWRTVSLALPCNMHGSRHRQQLDA